MRELHLDIERGRVVRPQYLIGAHIAKVAPLKGGRLITDAVADAAAAVVADDTARYTNDYGEHFARYSQSVGMTTVQQITEDMLLGFCRHVILTQMLTRALHVGIRQ